MPFASREGLRFNTLLNHCRSEETRFQQLKTFLLHVDTFLVYVEKMVTDVECKKEIHDAIYQSIDTLLDDLQIAVRHKELQSGEKTKS